jgi:predicted permease
VAGSPRSPADAIEQSGRDVTAVFAGFATIGALIALGVFLGHVGLLDLHAQQVLARLAFYVASPALMLTTIADADVAQVLSRSLVASAGAVAVVTISYVVLSRLLFRRGLADSVIGVLCAAYVNAGNLGIPIAAYVLGDASLVAPTLLMQMLVLQPVALALLDTGSAGRRLRWFDVLRRPLTTPLTVGSLIGLAIALTGVSLPAPVRDPLELVAAMAVPAMLLAYGVSLRLGPRPGLGDAAELGTITALKLVVQPVASYALGRFVLDLEQPALLAVTVVAALPTAQNIFVHALRYQRRETLARDSIFITTVLSVPAILVVTALVA